MGICKKFMVKKPTGTSRYGSGQAKCQICDIWIDYHGVHTKDGSPAIPGSDGWFCNCCNYRVRKHPRNKKYKEKLRNLQNNSNIPKYHQLMLPILQICSQKHYTRKEIENVVADRLNLTEQERRIILRNKETYLTNRMHWAILYLRKANLLAKEDNLFHITKNGQEILEQNPSKIDKKFLLTIPMFAQWIKESGKKDKSAMGDKLDDLIKKSLDLIKHDGMYLSDLAMTLNVSDAVRDLLVHKLLKIQGVTKEDIQYQGEILETLLKYQLTLDDNQDSSEINLSYFNKLRAKMLQKIFQNIEKKEDLKTRIFQRYDQISGVPINEIESEFDIPIKRFIELAYSLEPPNKISMIREFERVRSLIGRVPTKQDIEKYSEFKPSQYEKEFQSWEHLLERLGDDPWYRNNKGYEPVAKSETTQDKIHYPEELETHSGQGVMDHTSEEYEDEELKMLRHNIRDGLKSEPKMLKLFSVLDQKIVKFDKAELQHILDKLD